jgi:hypothetical protein
MKKFLVLVLAVISINCFSQDTTVIYKQVDTSKLAAIPDSAKLTFGKVYNDVKSGLSGLAAGLKVGVSHVYEILVKQQIVSAVTNTIGYVIVITLIMISYRNFKKEEDWNDPGKSGMLCIITVIGAFLIWVFGCDIDAIITGFINPEYGAIKEIINFVK